MSFIETTRIENSQLDQRILDLSAERWTVVFTSLHAVEAVLCSLSGSKPQWNIFCIGYATKNLVEEHFGKSSINGTADSAAQLADLICRRNDISSVIFFCGDKRREELSNNLISHQVEVIEIEVYKTRETPQSLRRQYAAILFYSPSAVSSFFSANTIPEQTLLFAIGNTTADEIKKYALNKIVVGNQPAKELLVADAINYFQSIIHDQ